jgi:hypothetical protein
MLGHDGEVIVPPSSHKLLLLVERPNLNALTGSELDDRSEQNVNGFGDLFNVATVNRSVHRFSQSRAGYVAGRHANRIMLRARGHRLSSARLHPAADSGGVKSDRFAYGEIGYLVFPDGMIER